MSALEVDAVLRRLPALELYSSNVFRVTGLAPDASPAQLRRRREEAELMARLGGGSTSGSAGATELKDAFEAVRNPVLRLVHELFWTWDVPGPHDDAVRAHADALTSTSPEPPWAQALDAWAAALDDPQVWKRMELRARELDDPRVTPATVARLRDAAPLRVLAPGAHLAAAAALAGDEVAAARHVEVLNRSPFGPALAARAVRDAVRATEAHLREDADAATRAIRADPAEADAEGRRLLAATGPGLRAFALLLPDDPLTAALHDEVAHAVAAAAVAHYDATGRAAPALELLEAAGPFVRERTTADFVARNRRSVADARVLAVVAPLQAVGNVDAAADVLRLWRKRCTDPSLRELLERLVEDPRAVRAPVGDTSSHSGHLGCGVRPYGKRARGDDDTWVETRCVSLFGVPLFPLGAYLSDERYVYAKVPMSAAARWAQLVVLWALAVFIAGVAFGPVIGGITAVALAAVLGADVVRQRRKASGWLDGQPAGMVDSEPGGRLDQRKAS